MSAARKMRDEEINIKTDAANFLILINGSKI